MSDPVKSDLTAISQWHALQSKKVQSNAKVVSAGEVGSGYMLHIDKTTPKKFIPMMPRSAALSEDNTTARITVAPTLMGCFIGYARGHDDFWYGTEPSVVKASKFRGGYDICVIPFTHCLQPNEKLVYDALRSGEHWLVPYDKKTLEYIPVSAGKVFLSDVTIQAVSGCSPASVFTMWIECTTPEGFKFSASTHLKPGCYRVKVAWSDTASGDVKDEKAFKVVSVSKADYGKAKALSANLLSHEAALDQTQVYQEEAGGTFGSDGKAYDLNRIFRAVAKDPVLTIEVSKLVWVLSFDKTETNEKRDRQADLSAPLLVTLHKGKELVVDGGHRLRKAVKLGVKTLPYRRVSAQVLKDSEIKLAAESLPAYLGWK